MITCLIWSQVKTVKKCGKVTYDENKMKLFDEDLFQLHADKIYYSLDSIITIDSSIIDEWLGGRFWSYRDRPKGLVRGKEIPSEPETPLESEASVGASILSPNRRFPITVNNDNVAFNVRQK